MTIVYILEFLTNCGKWQKVGQGTKEYIKPELKKRAELFHDSDRYRIRRVIK